MKTFLEHIEHAKTKPHHVRKRITFAIAGGASALIALIWFVGSISAGSFAIQGSSFADSSNGPAITTDGSSDNSTSGVAGAAAALQQDANAPAHIEIIDTSPATSSGKRAEQTTIPF